MEQVVLVIHLLLALAIIILVLLQRSEGGGLGMGGGGGLGSLAGAHQTANALTRLTTIFAGCFFGTSLLLAILAGTHSQPRSILAGLDSPVAAITVPDDSETPVVIPSEEAEEGALPSVPVGDE